jgi:deoxyribose-phosphate aldolase
MEPRPPLATYEDLAAMFVHPLVRPELTDEHLVEGMQVARRYGIAAVMVRPSDIDLAVRTLQGGAVFAGSVCAFPHGSANTATKLYEARDLLRRGAREIEVVVAVSKLLSREFQHVQTELLQMAESCHKENARLTVTLETGYLTDELKTIACMCCERAEVDFVKPSTGFGPANAGDADLRILRKYLPDEVGLVAEGAIGTVEDALAAYELGCSRLSTNATAAVLDQWKARLTPQTQETA